MNSGINALGPGNRAQRDHRTRLAARGPQRRRRATRRRRPRDARPTREVHVLLRGTRGRVLAADAGRAGLCADPEHGHPLRRRRSAWRRRPALPHARVADAFLRRVPANHGASEVADRVRRDARSSRRITFASSRRPAGPRPDSARRSAPSSNWTGPNIVRGADGIDEGHPRRPDRRDVAEVP